MTPTEEDLYRIRRVIADMDGDTITKVAARVEVIGLPVYAMTIGELLALIDEDAVKP